MIPTLSALLRTQIRSDLGRLVLEAIQDHLYHKSVGEFDPTGRWQTMEVLRLSELSHRLTDYANAMTSTSPLKLEATRLARVLKDDFDAVYEVAMSRTVPVHIYNETV